MCHYVTVSHVVSPSPRFKRELLARYEWSEEQCQQEWEKAKVNPAAVWKKDDYNEPVVSLLRVTAASSKRALGHKKDQCVLSAESESCNRCSLQELSRADMLDPSETPIDEHLGQLMNESSLHRDTRIFDHSRDFAANVFGTEISWIVPPRSSLGRGDGCVRHCWQAACGALFVFFARVACLLVSLFPVPGFVLSPLRMQRAQSMFAVCTSVRESGRV